MEPETEVQLPQLETPPIKKLHWTQMPENKERLLKLRKKHHKTANPVKDTPNSAFCSTCQKRVANKYEHRQAYPGHQLLFAHATKRNGSPTPKYGMRGYCITCAREVGDRYYHRKKHPSHRLRATQLSATKPRAPRVPGGSNPARSAFCFTCKKKFSNKYEHREKYPTHRLDKRVFVHPSKQVNRPRGIISVLGSTVGQARKSNGHTDPANVSHSFTNSSDFMAGFKAGYDFRQSMELYAIQTGVPLYTLVASAAQVLRKE